MADDRSDEERFTELYERHHAKLLGYVLRRVGSDHAQDVLAETFAAAWRELDALPPDPLPWLYRAAGFRIANQRRSMNRQLRVMARIAAVDRAVGPDHAQQVVDAARIRDALQHLSAVDQEALRLVWWEDLDHASAAYVLGCSTATFRVRLVRARRRLAAVLRGQADVPAGPAERQVPLRRDPAREAGR